MNIQRFINKSLFHVGKKVIGLLIYFDGRLYMKYLTRLLVCYGFKLNGTPRFIAKSVKFDDFELITLGDRLVISMNVHFLTHDYSYTTALIAIGEKPDTDICIIREIKIGDNVFIGMNAIILPGVNIGNHVIIGAGSVVRGVIPDYSIVAGNPAVIIGDIREHVNKVKYRECQIFNIDKH
jgi:acetyltransferase-like isoleucine patch superfamily enzyme